MEKLLVGAMYASIVVGPLVLAGILDVLTEKIPFLDRLLDWLMDEMHPENCEGAEEDF